LTTDGVLVVDKPAGWTSHDVVAKLRKVYDQRRVGHAGTLDPDATGVLLVGLGRATRLLRFLQESGKTYRGRIVFGVATSTLDASGDVVEQHPMPLTRTEAQVATRAFVGDIEQLPPMVSAVKVGGRRLHQIARAGEDVERSPRKVHVERFDIEDFDEGPYPSAGVFVACGSGTYVRSLAADLGAALGGCAHLASLRRLSVGSFTLDDAVPLDRVEAAPGGAVLTPGQAMRDLEQIAVDDEQARAVRHGMAFPTGTLGECGAGPYAVVRATSGPVDLLAVYERRGAACRPAVVLADTGVG
jgi:tRNA pseudouridine55 synthase